MTGRGAALQGGLAVVGLALAYATWQRAPSPSAGDVVVLDATRNDLVRVRFEDGAKFVELERRGGEDADAGVWLKLSGRPDAKPPVPARELRGNEAAEKLLDKLAPLRAPRALGALAPDKLKELGLDGSSKKRIEITTRSDKRTFLVATLASGGDPALLDERDRRAYLPPRGLVADLESASSRLVDRTLHAFKLDEVAAVVVAASGKRRGFVRPNPQDPSSRLAPAAAPGQPDEMASNWHDKIWRLFPSDVLGKGETPEGVASPFVMVRVEYTGAGQRALGYIELIPGPWARTEHSAGWVKLAPAAADLVKEAESVTGH